MHRLVAVVVAALTLVGGLFVVQSQPAYAASCFSTSCNNLDPERTGCATDARTLDEISSYGVRFQLRYSPSCYAGWTRFINPTGQTWNTLFAQLAYTKTSTAPVSSAGLRGVQVTGPSGWTPMISYRYHLRVCYSDVWFTQPPATNRCSRAY